MVHTVNRFDAGAYSLGDFLGIAFGKIYLDDIVILLYCRGKKTDIDERNKEQPQYKHHRRDRHRRGKIHTLVTVHLRERLSEVISESTHIRPPLRPDKR